jgi:perosamine synthetase
MHTFGHPVDIQSLLALCRYYDLPLVEDAAEAMGSLHAGRHAGTFGSMGVLSFNGNKIVTTGGGGAILTNDSDLAKAAKHLTTTAKVAHPWELAHDQVGYNYRMPNLNAALGCAQLEQLPDFLRAKRALAGRYAAAFSDLAGVRFFTESEPASSNHWLNTLILEPDDAAARDPIIAQLRREGIHARPAWKPMHQLPMYAHCPAMDLSTVESLAARIVNLPSSANL